MLFAHRLVSVGIGGRTVDELNDTMSVDEFLRWAAYDEMYPLGMFDEWFARLSYYTLAPYGNKSSVDKFRIGQRTKRKKSAAEMEVAMKRYSGFEE